MQDSMGVILFKVTGAGAKGSNQSWTVQAVKDAASNAGIPDNVIYDVKPRSAAIRGLNELLQNPSISADFRDRPQEDKDILRFAFVSRLPGMEYEARFVVDWNKETQVVSIVKAPGGVDRDAIIAEALAAIGAAKQVYYSADINRIVHRYLAKQSRKIMLRDGVYYVPHPFEEMGNTVRKFFKGIGVNYMSYTIGYDKEDAETIHEAIVADMCKKVAELQRQIEVAKKDTGDLSKRTASGRLADLLATVNHYKGLAMATRTEMQKLLDAAGDSGKALMDLVLTPEEIMQRKPGDIQPVALELFKAHEDYESAMVSIMQAPESAGPVLDVELDVPDVETPVEAEHDAPLFEAVI